MADATEINVNEEEKTEPKLQQWLSTLGPTYPQYAATLVEHGYDGIGEIRFASLDEILECVPKRGHARRILGEASLAGGAVAGSAEFERNVAKWTDELRERTDWNGVTLCIIFPGVTRLWAHPPPDWLHQDTFVRSCCQQIMDVPCTISYMYLDGSPMGMTFTKNMWKSVTFVVDLSTRLSKAEPEIVLRAEYANAIYQTENHSMTQRSSENEIVGSARRRLDRYREVGRLKIKSLNDMMGLLGFPIYDWESDGDFVDRQFSDDEPTTQSNVSSCLCDASFWNNLRQDRRQPWTPNEQDYEEYEISGIGEPVVLNGQTFYRVRWRGFGADSDTWEPEDHIPSSFLAARMDVDVDERSNSFVDSSQKMDQFRAKPDLSLVFHDLGATALKIELMSKGNARVSAYKMRAMEYAAQMLEGNLSQSFGVSILIRGRQQFWVFVCFRRAGRFCWWESERVPFCGRSTPRLADVLITLGKAGSRRLGIFPRCLQVTTPAGDLTVLNISQAIGFGGESCVFQASEEDPTHIMMRSRALSAYYVGTKVFALKFWRDPEAFSRFIDCYEALQQRFSSEHLQVLMGFVAASKKHSCIVMPAGVGAYLVLDAGKWVDLAERLWDFHEQTNKVHLDISPGNIIWHGGRLYLIDFGHMLDVGTLIPKHSMTTGEFFKEVADYPEATYYQDQVMFLRTVDSIAQQGKAMYSVSNHDEKQEEMPQSEFHPATVIEARTRLDRHEFLQRVRRLFGFKV